MDSPLKKALLEGVIDALGFVGGGLAGGLAARMMGFDFLQAEGWGGDSFIGIMLVGLGAGLGRAVARKCLSRQP